MNALKSHKSLYDLVVVDSKGIEMDFANQLESRNEVTVYTKLPNGFYINTPRGKYNPDWAVAFREGSVKHIYFVAKSICRIVSSVVLRKARLNVPVATSRPSATTDTSTTLPGTTRVCMIL